MAIEHKNIADPNIHPPKGFGGAATDSFLTKNGLGEVVWAVPSGSALGQLNITGNNTARSIAAAIDPNLQTDADYIKMSGIGFPWSSSFLSKVSFDIDQFQIQVPGHYRLDFWSSLRVAINNRFVGVRFARNGVLAPQRLITRSTEAADIRNIAASAIIDNLEIGDTISLWVAANAATDITLQDAGFSLTLLKHLYDSGAPS